MAQAGARMRTVRRGIVRWIVTHPIETPLANSQAAGQTRAGPYSSAEDLLICKNSLGKSKGKLRPGARDYDTRCKAGNGCDEGEATDSGVASGLA